MFKIGSQRQTWMAVRWTGLADDGSPVENEIQCRVQLVDRADLKGQMLSEQAAESETWDFASRVTSDWRDVADADGSPLGFATDKFALLWEAPGFASAWGIAYLQAWNGQSGIREKNSEASPADGPAAGATKRKPAA